MKTMLVDASEMHMSVKNQATMSRAVQPLSQKMIGVSRKRCRKLVWSRDRRTRDQSMAPVFGMVVSCLWLMMIRISRYPVRGGAFPSGCGNMLCLFSEFKVWLRDAPTALWASPFSIRSWIWQKSLRNPFPLKRSHYRHLLSWRTTESAPSFVKEVLRAQSRHRHARDADYINMLSSMLALCSTLT